MAKMTRMQQKIYDYIAQALREQGYPPSVREIGEAVGLKSPSTVHFHLKHMEELGVLTKGAGKGRALTLAQPMQGETPDARRYRRRRRRRRTASPWWAPWPRAAPYWRRSALRTI